MKDALFQLLTIQWKTRFGSVPFNIDLPKGRLETIILKRLENNRLKLLCVYADRRVHTETVEVNAIHCKQFFEALPYLTDVPVYTSLERVTPTYRSLYDVKDDTATLKLIPYTQRLPLAS